MPVGVQISVLPVSPLLTGTELLPLVTVGVITALTQASSVVATFNTVSPSNPFSIGQDVAFSGVTGMTQINSLHGIVSAIGGASGAWTVTVPINSTAFSAYTSGGELTSTVAVTSAALGLPALDPLRFGAIGDGVTDDTAALNAWVAAVNASTNPQSVWSFGKTFLCSGLNPITANNFTLQANGSTIKIKTNSWITTGDGTTHLALSATTGARLYNLTMDGNQAAWSVSGWVGRFLQLGNDTLLVGCTFHNSPSSSIRSGAAQGRFVACHFDDNAGSGFEMNIVSYLKFTDCTFNRNGYGFQKTLATNVFASFGLSIRFRSHHLTFVNCEAMQNGRDGMNVNQGSYAIKFIGCTCWMNGDGGFTVAADSTSVGTAGDAESPYDLEYVDCESYNNLTSGLAIYPTAYNVTVEGGRYYNNNRTAGLIAQQSSFTNGIYVAAGSLGVRIRTKAYDDRQFCAITANAAGVLSATNWGSTANWGPGTGVTFSPTAANYPRVALYSPAVSGPGLTFQGYGTITAESAGSVTIATTAFNGVTIASIVAGWYVTQRVQHNGVFIDNGCTASADVDGFGQLPGPQLYMGFKTISGYNNSNQNVLLPAAPLDYTELLSNPTWDAATTGWTYSTPGGGSPTLFTTAGPLLRSAGCLQLIAGTSAAGAQSTLITNGLSYVANGAWVEGTVWAYATLPNQCALVLIWGAGALNTTVIHPGGGWRQLRIGAYIPPGTSTFLMQLNVSAGATVYFDTASLRVRNETFDSRDFSYPSRFLSV
jgi:hypothetical protein